MPGPVEQTLCLVWNGGRHVPTTAGSWQHAGPTTVASDTFGRIQLSPVLTGQVWARLEPLIPAQAGGQAAVCRLRVRRTAATRLTTRRRSRDLRRLIWPPAQGSANDKPGDDRAKSRENRTGQSGAPTTARKSSAHTRIVGDMCLQRSAADLRSLSLIVFMMAAMQGSSISAVRIERTAHPVPSGDVSADQRHCVVRDRIELSTFRFSEGLSSTREPLPDTAPQPALPADGPVRSL